MDEIIKAISGDGFVMVFAISSRGITERARTIHNSSPVVTAALGRTLSAASMIGSTLKKTGASLTVRINGGGPAGSIIVVSDDVGNVRGFVANPSANVPNLAAGKLNVGGVVGKNGMLSVVKDFGEGEPYKGSVELVSGEIAEDFTSYFVHSEQTPTVCALGVLVGGDGVVISSGGYILQVLPGAPEHIIDAITKNVDDIGAVSSVLANNDATSLAMAVMTGFAPQIIEKSIVEYKCFCSRDRALSIVAGLDKSEIDDIKIKAVPVEVTCQFCDAIYLISPDEI